MKMPNPIAIRFAKLIFSILSITVLGVIFAMISHDHKLLILSAGVAITGGVKACSFYRQVSRQQYRRSSNRDEGTEGFSLLLGLPSSLEGPRREWFCSG